MSEFVKRQLADAMDLLRKIDHKSLPQSRTRGGVADAVVLAQTLHFDYGMPQPEAVSTATSLQTIDRWRALGTPTFALTEDLTAALIQTDPGSTNIRDLPLPLDVFCIELPTRDPLVRLELDGAVVPIESIFVARGLIGLDERLTKHDLLERADELATSGVGICIYAQDCHMTLFLRDSETVKDIQRVFSEALGHNTTGEMLRTAGSVTAMAINFCFYLADMPRRAWGGDKRRLPARGPRDVVSVPVGREIKLPQDLVQAARELASAGETGAKWRIRARFVVRGHWRNQAVGKGRAEHKRIWIQPFWKNEAGLGEVIARRYRVDTPK